MPIAASMNGAQTLSSPSAKTRLRGPGYFGLQLQAATAIRDVDQLGWYDSHFLRRIEVAKRYLAKQRPEALAHFVTGFAPLKPRHDFRETLIDAVFDAATHDAIIAVSRAAKAETSTDQQNENQALGREVVWDHPFFLDLQERLRARVSDIVGEPLVSSYNFLEHFATIPGRKVF